MKFMNEKVANYYPNAICFDKKENINIDDRWRLRFEIYKNEIHFGVYIHLHFKSFKQIKPH